MKAEISTRIGQTLPRLFWGCEMENLPKELRQTLDGLPADRGLYIFGPVGCGKSYTLAAIAKQRIQCDVWPVQLLNWERFLSRLRAGYDDEPGTTDRMLLRAEKAAVLLIDDLSICGRESDFSLRTLYSILDYRVENCLPTFFAANKSPDEIGKAFDVRIASRIIGHCEVIHLSGRDRRTAGK